MTRRSRFDIALLASRWRYYLFSIPTILLNIRNWLGVLGIFVGVPVRRPLLVRLRTGERFWVSTAMDVWILKESCLDRFYEKDGTIVQDGWNVIDIGAGMGDFAISVALRCPKSIVYAFEPFPESFAKLNDHRELNGTTNVHAFREALAGTAGSVRVYSVTGVSGQNLTGTGNDAEGVETPATTLDEVFTRLKLTHCDFLKIDCEGAEYEIMFHATADTLRRIRHISMEYHDGVTSHSHGELRTSLERHGIRVQVHGNAAHRNVGYLYATNAG